MTVNKNWFGGTGVENWGEDRVETFREHAMAFLPAAFPNGQSLYAASHSNEEAFNIHFAVAAWQQTVRKRDHTGIDVTASAT